MDLIKLLDISNPKTIKDTLNNVVDYTKQQTAETTELSNTAITEATEAKGIAIGAVQYAETAVDTAQVALENTNNLLDGNVPVAKAVADELGNNLVNTYATKLSVSGLNLEMSYASDTGVLGIVLKDSDGNILSESSKDLPLELLISSGTYNSDTKEIILTLANGDVLNIDVKGLINTYLADEETLTLEGNVFKIKDEFKALISKTGIEQLVGTEEKPINFATDMEVGHLYSVTGYVFRASSLTPHNITFPLLVFKNLSNNVLFYNGYLTKSYNGTNSLGGTQGRLVIDATTGEFTSNSSLTKSYNLLGTINGTGGGGDNIWAPTSSGSQGQVLTSKGSGAPVWSDLAASGVEHIVGTADKPINVANDLQSGNLYVLSGHIVLSSTVTDEVTPILTLKVSDTGIIFYGAYRFGKYLAPYPYFTSKCTISSDGTISASHQSMGIRSLNGSSNYASPPDIYAPRSSGSSGQILQSNGSGSPTGVDANYATLDDITNAINGAWEGSY